jgi:hypothetical protein
VIWSISGSGQIINFNPLSNSSTYLIAFTGAAALSVNESHYIEIQRKIDPNNASQFLLTCWVDGNQFGNVDTQPISDTSSRYVFNQIGKRHAASYWGGKIGAILYAPGVIEGTQRQANLRAFFQVA